MLHILTRASGFPRAQCDMLQLTAISRLVIYSIDYLENVYFLVCSKICIRVQKLTICHRFFKIGGIRECFPQIRAWCGF